MRRIYLDHSATTPIDSRVVDAMMPYLTQKFGNASSIHQFGQEARAAVDKARRQIASLISARSNEIVFTSGGTEANNLAIRGVCEAAQVHGRHIITSAIEHPSVRGVLEYLEKNGWTITRLPVYDNGVVRVEDVRAAIRADTVLISVMMANNEIGTIQPVKEIGALVFLPRVKVVKSIYRFIPTPSRLQVEFRSMSKTFGAICCRCRRTKCMRRKELGRCSFVAACVCFRSK